MATVTYSVLAIGGGDDMLAGVTWGNLQNGDLGSPLSRAQWADRSIQVEGTFGSGGSLALEGSNDGTNYRVLNDPGLNKLNITAAGITQINEITAFVRPHVTAGDGSTALTVTIVARRNTPNIH
jgi:hypothetical protein